MLRNAARRVTAAATVLAWLAFLAPQAAHANERVTQWSLAHKSGADDVSLRMRYERREGSSLHISDETHPVPISALHGVSAADIDGTTPVARQFQFRAEPGTFECDGTVGGGRGSGTFRFTADPAFARELTRRGVSPATDDELMQLALSHFKFATLDAVVAAGFDRPSPSDLLVLADRGLNAEYVLGFRDVPLAPKTLQTLMRLRDRGVSGDYVRALSASGYRLTSPDDLATLRDHGVKPSLVAALAAGSYRNLSVSEIATLSDHGVTAEYIRALDRTGYHPSVSELVRLRDSGVSVAFVQRLRDHGYGRMSVDDIIRLYQHGI